MSPREDVVELREERRGPEGDSPSARPTAPASRVSGAVATGLLLSALLGYLGLVCVGIVVHEPWFDEAQAWLLARDASVPELLTTYLRYEGHPPLWYLILAVPARLGLPFKTINVVSAAIASVGVVLLLLRRTIPLIIRLLLPFTFFVAYQYTIVSRSYVLVLPLLLQVLGIYERRRERLWGFVCLLVLLSQVSLHGMSIAGGLTLLYLIDLGSEWRVMARREVVRHLLALGTLLLNVGVAALVLYPPRDLAIRSKLDFGLSPGSMVRVGWRALSSTLAGPNLISILVLLGLGFWFLRRRTLGVFLVLLVSLLPISTIYFNYWHEGLFFLVLAFCALLSFDRAASEPRSKADRRIDRLALGVVAGWLLLHVSWSVSSYRFDISQPYSGSLEAARYLAEHGIDQKRLFGAGFPALAIQPYFESNVFSNYPTRGDFSFWDWSTGTPWFYRPRHQLRLEELRAWTARELAARPDYFLVSLKFPSDYEYERFIAAQGTYLPRRTFEGGLFWKGGVVEREAFVLFERQP